jgi:hypothetical protein
MHSNMLSSPAGGGGEGYFIIPLMHSNMLSSPAGGGGEGYFIIPLMRNVHIYQDS